MVKKVIFNKTLANVISTKAEELSLTSESIANSLGVSTTTISFYRTGSRLPSAETAIRLGEILSIDKDKILSLRFESVLHTVNELQDNAPEYCKNEVLLASFIRDNLELLNCIGN